jgi:hypothetical protein
MPLINSNPPLENSKNPKRMAKDKALQPGDESPGYHHPVPPGRLTLTAKT